MRNPFPCSNLNPPLWFVKFLAPAFSFLTTASMDGHRYWPNPTMDSETPLRAVKNTARDRTLQTLCAVSQRFVVCLATEQQKIVLNFLRTKSGRGGRQDLLSLCAMEQPTDHLEPNSRSLKGVGDDHKRSLRCLSHKFYVVFSRHLFIRVLLCENKSSSLSSTDLDFFCDFTTF